MVLANVAGVIVLVLLFATVPKLVRAQVRGRTASAALGHAPAGVPTDEGDGLRRVVIDGEIAARTVEASLRDEGLDVRVVADGGEALGGLASLYAVLYRANDETRVLEAVAALD